MIDPWNTVSDRLKLKLKSEKDAPYPKLLMTSTESSETPPSFPCMFVNQLGSPQTSDDLSGTKQNAVISTIELQVFSTSSILEARNIMNNAGDVMISMGYALIYGPEQNNTTKYRMIARFRRIVCEGDKL